MAHQRPLGDLVDNGRVTQWRLGDAIAYLLGNCPRASLSVVTAYLNLGAFKVLERALSKVTRLRILVGKEQEQPFVLTNKLFEEFSKHFQEVKKDLKRFKSGRVF